MSFTSALRPFSLALILYAGITGAAAAEDAATPSDTQQRTAPDTPKPSGDTQNPVADAGTAAKPICTDETEDYVTHGKSVSFVIGIVNTCEQRLRCEIFANVTGARGSALGHTTLILGAKSSGAAAKKSYAMKVKAAGGVAQVSRKCRDF